MAFPFLLLAIVIVGMIGMMLLMPKPKVENARPETLDKLNFPTASEGSPLPLILGKVRHRGPNTLWYGDFESVAIKKKVKTGLFSSKKVTTGYKYYVGLDLGLGLGPGVQLTTIWFDKDEVWTGTVGPNETSLSINKPSLWGGEEKGGGFTGTLRFYGGQFSQPQNAYVLSKVANDLPAYVGQSHIVLEHCYIGTQAMLRTMSFELSRYTNSIGLGLGHERIGDDMNPAEMLFQIMTLEWGGLDVDPNDIDLPTFVAVGEVLYTEGNGMSLIISSPNSGRDAIEEVLRQVDGVMYQDPVSGKILLRLIRDDYDLLTLPVLDKTNVSSVRSFARTSWDDTVNQVRVTYTNRVNKYEKGTAIVQDLANINSQGRIRPVNLSYPGVTVGDLANRLASREMAQMSVPLFRATLEVNREAADLRPGDAFMWSWDEYEIAQVVMRVQKFSLGDLVDGRVVIDCVQDKFALDQTIFAAPEPSGHVPYQDKLANPVTARMVRESPYFLASASGLAIAAANSLVLVSAVLPANADSYDVWTSADGVEYAESSAEVVPSPRGTLGAAITAAASLATGMLPNITVNMADSSDLEAHTAAEVAQGAGLFFIGGELFAYEGKAVAGAVVTLSNVWRSLLDTTPGAHAIGDAVWFLDGSNVIEDIFGSTATVRVKLATRTVDDLMDYTTDAGTTLVLQSRPGRPLPPAAIKFGAAALNTPPANGASPVTITWANRNRLETVVRKLGDTTSKNEVGQTTTIRWRKNGGAWTDTTYAPGIATATIDTASLVADLVEWEIYSSRDGLDSFAKWQFASGAAAPVGASPDAGGGDTGGGSGGGGGGTGGTPPVDTTPTYVVPPDDVSLVFPFGAVVGVDPIDLPITFPIKIPAGLAGTNVDHRTNPAVLATFTLKKNNVAVGTVAVSAAGGYTFTAAAAINLAAGDTLTCQPPNPADATLAGLTITVAGTRV
jgi:hypothetical protein